MPLTRRRFLKASAIAGTALLRKFSVDDQVMAQSDTVSELASVETPVLTIGYGDSGSKQGFPVILLHGFPDDIHAFDDVTPALVKAGQE